MTKEQILSEIKRLVQLQEPTADIILYGSYARGDYKSDSDMDILILVDKDNITRDDQKRISYPLFDLEFSSHQVISPLIKPKKAWYQLYPNTALFINIKNEGVHL